MTATDIEALRVGLAILDAHGQWEQENNRLGGQYPWGREHCILLGRTAIAAISPQPADGCSSNEGAAAWDREICTGCTSSLSIADIKARGVVSCCPDRHMVRIGDLVDAYTARPPRILPQTEKGS